MLLLLVALLLLLHPPCKHNSAILRTELDERIGPRDRIHLAAIQPAELSSKLLQVLKGQLLGVALLC
jgi:hypothetical protein